MATQNLGLADFGWKPSLWAEIDADELERSALFRVMAVHRGHLAVAGPDGEALIAAHLPAAQSEEDYATVGDWLLVDRKTRRPQRLLARSSLFKRRAPGAGRRVQLLAANVDTVFIVSSCNQDFNMARLERFLVMARDAGVMAVVVLTKADLVDDSANYAIRVRQLQPGLVVEAVDARDPLSLACLAGWHGQGQTVACMGSSGVGKSTLIATLTGSDGIATRAVREDDDKGRHTTTARSLHRLVGGGWLIDTPGMRELQLTDATSGLDEVFDDIGALARSCRFSDCAHHEEPGCAVRAAIEDGTLDTGRLARWRKLEAEERHNTESLAERRARDRSFGKMVRAVAKEKQGRRRPDR